MNPREMRAVLKDCLEYIDSLERAYRESFKDYLGEDAERAIEILKERIDYYEHEPWIPSMKIIVKQVHQEKEHAKEWEDKQRKDREE